MSTYVEPDGTLKGGRRSGPRSWRWGDRIFLALAWSVGIVLCVIAVAIVAYLAVQGVRFLSPGLIFSRPQVSLSQTGSGGFLDPLLGTCILALIGTAIAIPLAVCAALWIVEYGRPSWLARVVESAVEVIAGTPDIVIALFGLSVFQLGLFAPLSFVSEKGGVFGQSLVIAGIMMSLLAIPPIFAATRDGLQQVPIHLREAAFALGKTRITTIRRILLPRVRSNVATGVTLGVSRIIGDTAIVLLLAGATLRIETQGGIPGLNVLRGTGGSLTTYVFDNSPAGEGGAPEKAYAAAFLLLMFILALNLTVERIGRRDQQAGGAAALTQGVV